MPLVLVLLTGSFLLSLALVPIVRRLSFRWGRVAIPRQDRWHRQPTPTLGGIAMYAAFLVTLLAYAGLTRDSSHWGLLAGASILFGLGVYDDFKRISPPAKLAGQILAASLVIFLGYTTSFFNSWFTNHYVAQIPDDLLTFFWLIGITNAINLLDNMDGLAGGIALIAALTQSVLFWRSGDFGMLAISLALAGAILGFLVYNYPPAKIFMGDSGSLFLGFTLATLAIARQPQASNTFAVLAVPTLLFLLPILDTSLVTITRLLRGQSPAQGGRDHTSHRLIAFGLSERKALLVLYSVAVASGLLAVGLERMDYWISLVLVPGVVVILALLTAYLGGLKVVGSNASSARAEQVITRVMLELTYRRRLLEVALDFFLTLLAYYLAFFTRFGFTRGAGSLRLTLQSLPVALAAVYISYFVFDVYRAVWRYVSATDFVRYFKAAAGAAILAGAAVYLLYSHESFSPLTYLAFGVYLFIALAASRSSFKLLDSLAVRQGRADGERVLVCGAGDAGEMALRWMLMNAQLGYRPVGFVDPDPFMAGRQIHGIEVLGGVDQLEGCLERLSVDGVILASEAFQAGELRKAVLEGCQRHGTWVRALRLEFEPVG